MAGRIEKLVMVVAASSLFPPLGSCCTTGLSPCAQCGPNPVAKLAQQEGRPPADYFEVRVPALNVTFIGRRRGAGVFLSPVIDHAGFRFQKGQTLPADQALAAMVSAARAHNDLPT